MSNKVRVAQAVILPRLSETEVTVQTAVSGMTLLHPNDKKHTTRRISLASGVSDIRPLTPFRVKVINLSPQEQRLPKEMVLGYALPHPTLIITLVDEAKVSHESPQDERAPEIPLVSGFEQLPPTSSSSSDELAETWKDEVELSQLTPKIRTKVLELLSSYGQMWDGTLGTIKETTHPIEINSGSRPVYTQPYRGRPQGQGTGRRGNHPYAEHGSY